MFLNRLSAVVGLLAISAVIATGAIGLAWSDKGPAQEARGEARAVVPQTNAGEPPQASPENSTTKPRAVARNGAPMSLTGQVVDEQGRPVPKADVRLRLFRTRLRPLRIAWEVVDAWEVRTDAEGRYRIEGVRGIQGDDSQWVALDVNTPDYVEFFNLFFSDLPGAAARKGNLPEVRLRRGVAVTGRCVGPDGKAVAGAKIHSAYAEEPSSSLGRTRTTDAAGRFRLTIPDGRNAELIVYPQALAPRRVSVPAGGGELGDIPLEVGIELVGQLAAEFRNEVFVGKGPAEGLTAKALVPAGHLPVGKVIALESTDRGQFGWFPITLAYQTDRDGKFRVPALKGSFKIWVAKAHDAGLDDRGPVVGNDPVPAVMPRIMDFDPSSGRQRQPLLLATGPEVAIRGTITGLGWEHRSETPPCVCSPQSARGTD